MSHMKINVVSYRISEAIFDALYMFKHFLPFLHGPNEVRFTQDLYFTSSELDFMLRFLNVKNFFKNILKDLKIYFDARSKTFFTVNLGLILFLERYLKIFTKFKKVTNCKNI